MIEKAACCRVQVGVCWIAIGKPVKCDMQYVYLVEFQLLPRAVCYTSVCNECDGQ